MFSTLPVYKYSLKLCSRIASKFNTIQQQQEGQEGQKLVICHCEKPLLTHYVHTLPMGQSVNAVCKFMLCSEREHDSLSFSKGILLVMLLSMSVLL